MTAGEAFQRRAVMIRKDWGWTQEYLADRLNTLGWEEATDVLVSRTENGKRRLSIDEFVMWAAALEVSPVALIGELELSGRRYSVDETRAWFRGERPLDDPTWRFYAAMPLEQFLTVPEGLELVVKTELGEGGLAALEAIRSEEGVRARFFVSGLFEAFRDRERKRLRHEEGKE